MRTNIKLGFKYHFYTEKILLNEFMKSHPKSILQYSMRTLKTWKKNQNKPRNVSEEINKYYIFLKI